jgi:microcystin-dependent protein
MASTYSPDLRIELIANGEKSGTWGTITNLNLGTIIEDAIAGAATVTTASAAQALTVSNGAQDQARCSTLVLNTAAASNYNVYVPPVPKLYVVRNTSATYTCTLYASTVAGNTTAAGSGITVPTSTSMLVRCDGTNIVDQTNYVSGALAVGGNFSVAGTATGVTPASGDSSTKFATTAFVNSVVAGGFPSGGIIMWNGSVASIPAGWVLCNGSSGTPDLRDRFVVGAGSTYAVNATGGSANATLVSHDHTFSATTSNVGDHNHSLVGSSSGSGGSGAFENRAPTGSKQTGDAGSHDHTVSGTTSSQGSSATNANLPPYFALCYIMKL